ncbi:MAG: L-serine ammonia-lyase, iron-sulfur-dependent subunit beta [Lachnospiraceae bacterium]
MKLTDIIGPVMVGPSSSHTAGAVRIGSAARRLLGEPVRQAEIGLHGSFYATGRGHGTDKALVAGLLGMSVDDRRIADSFAYARSAGLSFTIKGVDLGDSVHPNSAKLELTGVNGKQLEIVGASIGGGRIVITELDGLPVNFSGDFPTLIVHNEDMPGHVAKVTSLLSESGINIAYMQLNRAHRGGQAVMVLECDQEVPHEVLERLEAMEGVVKVTFLSLLTEGE